MFKRRFLIWVILFITTFIFRLPNLSEPAYLDDEYFNLTVGNSIKNGAVLYEDISDIHIGKPPLVFLIASIFNTQLSFRLLVNLWCGFGTIFFFELSYFLFGSLKKTFLISLFYILLTSTPLIEGIEPYNELFLLPLPLLSLRLILTRVQHSIKITTNSIKIIFGGFFLGIGILIKLQGLFDLMAILLVLSIFLIKHEKSRLAIKTLGLLIIGAFIPIIISTIGLLLWGVSINRLLEMIKLGYLYTKSSDTPLLPNIFLKPELISFKIFILIIWFFFVMFLWKKYKLETWLISTWLVFVLTGSVLLNIIGLHYTLLVVPSVILCISAIIFYFNKTKILPLFLGFCLILIFHLVYPIQYINQSNILNYYNNYFLYKNKKISFNTYANSFGSIVVRNYELANYLNQLLLPKEKIFIWGIYTELYSLTNTLPITRYIWHEHISWINDYDRTLNKLNNVKPKYIIMFSENPMSNEKSIVDYIHQNYFLLKEFDSSSQEKAYVYCLLNK